MELEFTGDGIITPFVGTCPKQTIRYSGARMGYIYKYFFFLKKRATFGYFRQKNGTLGTLELLVNGVETTPIETMILGMVDGIEFYMGLPHPCCL